MSLKPSYFSPYFFSFVCSSYAINDDDLNVTGCGEIEHPPGSGHWVSTSGADLLLKGLSN